MNPHRLMAPFAAVAGFAFAGMAWLLTSGRPPDPRGAPQPLPVATETAPPPVTPAPTPGPRAGPEQDPTDDHAATPLPGPPPAGLVLEKTADGFRVDQAPNAGPAAAAGLHPGALIVSVAGQATTGLSHPQLAALVAETDGDTIEVVVSSEGTRRRLSLDRGALERSSAARPDAGLDP